MKKFPSWARLSLVIYAQTARAEIEEGGVGGGDMSFSHMLNKAEVPIVGSLKISQGARLGYCSMHVGRFCYLLCSAVLPELGGWLRRGVRESRVARLAFSRPNLTNLAYLSDVWPRNFWEFIKYSWPFVQVYAYLVFGLFFKSLFIKIQNLALFKTEFDLFQLQVPGNPVALPI